MKKEFAKWMTEQQGLASSTAFQYTRNIEFISEHYFKETSEKVDLYDRPNISLVKEILRAYGRGGTYSVIGEKGPKGEKGNGHGAVRAAIAAYVRFLEYKEKKAGNSDNNTKEPDNEKIKKHFLDAENWKHLIEAQMGEYFSDYKTFEGKNKTDYLLLENSKKKELLTIELKMGKADENIVTPFLRYQCRLKKKYPDKNIKAMIIAAEIDESLIEACSGPNIDIELMKYNIKFTLDKIVP